MEDVKCSTLALHILIMRKFLLLLFLLVSSTGIYAQKTLVLEKIGTPTRYGFHLGDDVKVQTKAKRQILRSYLWAITDSSLTIGPHTTVSLSDISAVYKHYYFPNLMTRVFFYLGAGYLVLDSFNNLINKERIFNPQTLIISGSALCVSCAIIPLSHKKCRIGIKWKLKIMEIDIR